MSDRGGALTRDVLLRIRAQNLSTADFKQVAASVNELTSALDKQLAAAARGEIKDKELEATLKQLGQAVDGLRSITVTIDRFKDFEKQITRAQEAAEQARTKLEAHRATIESSEKTTAKATKTLESLTGAYERAQAKIPALQAQQAKLGETLRELSVDTNNLAEAENQARAVADQVSTATTRLTEAKQNYHAILRQTNEALAAQKAAEAELAAVAKQRADEQRAAAEAYGRSISAQMAASMKDKNDQLAQVRKAEEDRAAITQEVAEKAAAFNERAKQARYDAVRAEVEANARLRSDAIQAEEAAERKAEADRAARVQDAIKRERAARDAVDAVRKAMQQEREEAAKPIPQPVPTGGRRTDAKGKVGAGEGQDVSILGLRPYELTNLGYQLNDVISGFASGQHAAQIFAQQSGQVIQIFGIQALRYLPAVTVAVAALVVGVGSLNAVLREVSSNREFGAAIDANVNATKYQKEALTELRKEIRDMGVSWSDAGKVIREAIEGNINQDRIKQLGQAAQDIADVFGKSTPDAMRELVHAFTGGEEEIGKLNDSYNFLTKAQLEHVRQLFAEGQQEQARAYALDLLANRMRRAADEALSPFSKALREISKTWDDLLETLGKTAVFERLSNFIVQDIKDLGDFVKTVDDVIRGVKSLGDLGSFLKGKLFEGGGFLGLPKGSVGEIGARELFGGGAGLKFGDAAYAPIPAAATPSTAGSSGRFANPRGLKIDTESLQKLAGLLTEASKGLPEGYRVEAISTERPGARVRRTGELSEHGFGHAIDVNIVDPNGRPVPGSMGPGGPLYDQLDKAMEAAAKKQGLGPLAVGSTFGDPDAGHYSLGGSEASRNAAKRGDTTTPSGPVTNGPTSEQTRQGQEAIRDEQERLRLVRARSQEEELAVEREKATRDAQRITSDKAQQDTIVQQRLDAVRYQQTRENFEYESRQRKQAIEDQRHLSDIQAAGDKAVATATAAGITNYKELRTIRDQGEAEERTRLQRLDSEKDRLEAIRNQVAGLQRGLDSKNATELSRALAAVDEQYKSIYNSLRKAEEQATPATKAALVDERQRIDALKERAKAEATVDSYQKQAQASEQTRSTLVQTANTLQEAGQISIEEKEKRIKAAYDLTSGSILEAADALQKLVDTDKSLSPERVALITAEIQKLRAQAQYVDPFMKGLQKTIQDSFGTSMSTAFNTVSQALGNAIAKTGSWKDVFTSLKTAVGQFFSGLLKDIAEYILKAEAAKLASSFFSSDSGGSGGGIGGFFSSIFGGGSSSSAAAGLTGGGVDDFGGGSALASVLHAGGVAGAPSPVRSAPVSWFDRAPRYHTGVPSVGLAANEQAAILKKGEEVLSQDNPRNIANLARKGGGAQQPLAIRAVLVDDRARIPEAMAGSDGEKVVLQHLVRNAATVRQIVK